MAEKQSKKSKRQGITEAALQIAAESGWEDTTFRAISERSGIPLAGIYDEFEDKSQLLAEFERRLNRKVLANMADKGAGSPRERLFDLLMERFDLMNEHRAGVIAILRSFRFDPKQIIIGAPHLAASMNWMLEAAGVDTSGLRGAAKVAGLTAIYTKVLRDWAKDESPDMSATMASLDRALDRAERTADSLGF